MKAPVQIEPTRPAPAASASVASTSSGPTAALGDSSPPATRKVSQAGPAVGEPATESRIPREDVTSAPSGETSTTSYDAPSLFASANTSAGPATSRSFTWSYTSIATRCGRPGSPAGAVSGFG